MFNFEFLAAKNEAALTGHLPISSSDNFWEVVANDIICMQLSSCTFSCLLTVLVQYILSLTLAQRHKYSSSRESVRLHLQQCVYKNINQNTNKIQMIQKKKRKAFREQLTFRLPLFKTLVLNTVCCYYISQLQSITKSKRIQ